jgi:hypothetical protein
LKYPLRITVIAEAREAEVFNRRVGCHLSKERGSQADEEGNGKKSRKAHKHKETLAYARFQS